MGIAWFLKARFHEELLQLVRVTWAGVVTGKPHLQREDAEGKFPFVLAVKQVGQDQFAGRLECLAGPCKELPLAIDRLK